jgi:predicted RNA methylase
MAKLTRAQRQLQYDIRSWLDGDLDLDPLKAIHGYIPEELDVKNAFYTPEDDAELIAEEVLKTDPVTVIDPCCGTGALLYPLAGFVDEMTGYELDPYAAQIAEKAVPEASIYPGDTFEVPNVTGLECDVVVMNPPFGGRILNTRSEYAFTGLALNIAKEKMVIVGSELFIDNMPEPLNATLHENWLLTKIVLFNSKYSQTTIKTYMYVFIKGHGAWAKMPEKEVNVTEQLDDPKTIVQGMLRDLDEYRTHLEALEAML